MAPALLPGALLAALLVLVAPVCDAGASAYTLLGELRGELDGGGAIVEVGSDRGEGSTAFLSALANATGRQFFSVDFSREGFENARSACGGCAQQAMGEQWLADSFPSLSGSARIVLAYLDNYDWTFPWTQGMQYKQQQHVDYKAQGLELGNARSQEVHLQQAMAVARLCSERCFVLFDDTWPSARPDVHSGKGGRALAFLLANGFEVVQQSAPETPSYMGWVLVRRLPLSQRHNGDALGEYEAPAPPEPATGDVRVSFHRHPSRGGGGSGLAMQVFVWGVLDGEHTLVVFSQGVEVLRYVDWASIPGECGEEGGGGGGCSERRTVPLVLRDGEDVARDTHIVVQVIDSQHRPVASAASSWRAGGASDNGGEEGEE